jgi:mannose-6-phosphate isomerase-like protein (cupin superfamily)
MRLKPGVEIGMELHDDVDQFIRIEKGYAMYSKNGKRVNYDESVVADDNNRVTIYDKDMKPIGTVIGNDHGELPQDHVLLVPRNTWHNVWNPKDAAEDVHIYTLYSFAKQNPPHKKDMQTQHEKKDEPKEEH